VRRRYRRAVQHCDAAKTGRRTGSPRCNCSRTASATGRRRTGASFLEERFAAVARDKIKKPLLIGQGANDPRVKQAESDQIVKAMQSHKIPVTYVLFSRRRARVPAPAEQSGVQRGHEAFLAKHLGGRYEAIGTALRTRRSRCPQGRRMCLD